MKFSTKEKPAPALSLEERIRLARDDAEAYVEQKVLEIKGSPSGSALPIDSLRQMLTKRDDCRCRVALRLIDEAK